jgi:gluconolactonase
MTRTFLALLAVVLSLTAAERVTTGAPKLVAEAGAREGPSWDPVGGILYFVSGNNVNRLNKRGQVETFRADAPGANGSLVDPEGRILVCEAQSRRVTRTEKDGTLTILADNYDGKKLNSPNDLALDSKGRIYFTDPRYGRMDDLEIQDGAGHPVEGVYRIDAPGRITRIITHEVERPNGILISPDNQYLYVADNYNNRVGGARKLWRFDLNPDGTIDPASRRLIFDWKTGRGPDGFKMDSEGRLYVAAGRNKANQFETADAFRGGIYILSGTGEFLEFVPFEKDEVTNCAFGGPDLKTLFVTVADQLWSVPVKTRGLISASGGGK